MSTSRRAPFRNNTAFHALEPDRVRGLPADHPAATEGRTMLPATVTDPVPGRVFTSGALSNKLGDRVTTGPLAGATIYALKLEERATCPRSCHNWLTCYGGAMPAARRNRHGASLEALIPGEVARLCAAHDRVLIRLHDLGDFYSVAYVELWAAMLIGFDNLHVTGFTARQPSDPIGGAIRRMVEVLGWERCSIRSSVSPTEAPALAGALPACGACGWCWHPSLQSKSIVFVGHGRKAAPGPRVRPQGETPAKVLEILRADAAAGRVASTNREIARRLGLRNTLVASAAVKRLEGGGAIIVRRYQRARQVGITATGQWTAVPENTAPHWRDRPVRHGEART